MICHGGGGGAMVVLCRPVLKKPMCLSSNTDQLRTQLDQLHSEAESTRAKANSARLRLLRLSEAVEKLKRQAAISVTSGKENDARELLIQKKKVMEAIGRSKNRIELLDQLSSKLNQVISMKENQLIGNVAFDVEVETEDDSNPVRIVSPKLGVTDFSSDDNLKFSDGQDLQLCADGETNQPVEESIIRGLKDVSSYEDFLEHLDVQLDKIEAELVTILNVSALVLNDNEKPNNFKVQQTIELLESVRAIRKKISGMMQKKVEIS
ncbi:FORKHEAD-ASSOCIATED DOMAIN PROTEIN [Salix koriyanagi]|uniref:FORKHEAD-ASSOCIATED DOMAIN PROTEIN n=1 Tax=Salix koriyanagi TaxID=2511006 RepID=A0A9Q0P4B3_9ROSI|nr:FORKHEAD-ASSOCIATED DOMAIN PROTEIN [Salix koriyanagi]KAJ6681417.1 FORKHEAD-ASSOCIATED DOMAIN PROTEIN [Salix koriyanagi]KAJ6681418.1 FORKHEAD-ASSOCIATED DOMAIN PROTEIN [Salix koriyanagi]